MSVTLGTSKDAADQLVVGLERSAAKRKVALIL